MSQPIIAIDSQQVAAHNPGLERLIEQFSASVREESTTTPAITPEMFEINERAYQRLLQVTRFRWNQ